MGTHNVLSYTPSSEGSTHTHIHIHMVTHSLRDVCVFELEITFLVLYVTSET